MDQECEGQNEWSRIIEKSIGLWYKNEQEKLISQRRERKNIKDEDDDRQGKDEDEDNGE